MLDDLFGFFVLAFAKVVKADTALAIDKIMRWPVVVVEGAPDGKVVIDRDRKRDAQIVQCALDITDVFFISELWLMNADHDQPLVFVLAVPLPHVRQGVAAVDAAKSPKIDQHHLAAQLIGRKRW